MAVGPPALGAPLVSIRSCSSASWGCAGTRPRGCCCTRVEKRGDTSDRIRMAVVPDFEQTTMLDFVK